MSDKARRLSRNKHSSLLQTFVNYGHKKFYNIGSRVLEATDFGQHSSLITTITAVKSFIVQTRVAYIIKLFTAVGYEFS